jgi:hypothetical protein
MNAFFVTICGLVILLGFEIRYRSLAYEISLLKIEINKLGEAISKLNAEMKLKQNIYEEH